MKISLLSLLLGLALFSCLSDPKEKTELQFKLDDALVGKFDSVTVSLFPLGEDTGEALFSKTVVLSEDQRTVTLVLPDDLKGPYSATLTGVKGGEVVFDKRYDYREPGSGPDSAVVDLKGIRDSLAQIDSSGPSEGSVITAEDLHCEVGETLAARVSLKPDSAEDKSFTLTSGDTATAGIAGDTLLCREAGSVEIEVTARRDGKKKSFTLVISPHVILLESISLDDQAAKVGDTVALNPVLKPDDATDKELSLSVDDSSVARVLDDLRLLALKAGETEVTLAAAKGEASHSFQFKVSSQRVEPEAIRIGDTDMVVFDTIAPLAKFEPDGTTERGYTLSSADTAVARVRGTRLVGMALGSVLIRIEAESGGVKDSFTVTVRNPVFSDIKPITKQWCGKCHSPTITFNLQDSAVLVANGSQARIRLALPAGHKDRMPADTIMDASDLAQLQRWLSLHVISVTGMSAEDGEMAVGDSLEPDIAFEPEDATNRNYTLSSDNNTVVLVANGKLVGLALGSANITATSSDGGIKASFEIKVRLPVFASDIKPITTDKCGKCHGPNLTFNLQDSTVLLSKGKEALRRIQLPISDKDHMPLDDSLTVRQLTMLKAWLSAHFVALQDVAVANDTLKVGQSKFAKVTFTPSNANNQNYSLISFDSSKVKLAGILMTGIDTGSVPMGLTTEEGAKSKTFTVRVIPWPVDSLHGVDTSVQVGDSALPRVEVYPDEATDKAITLVSLDTALAKVLSSGKVKAGNTVGNARLVAKSLQNPSVVDTFTLAVGPVAVEGLSVAVMNILVGNTQTPIITWTPPAATDKTFTLAYVSGSATAASVVGGAQLKGLEAGTALYRATSTDGAFTSDFTVNVGNVVATAITLSKSGPTYVDSTQTATVTWTPANTTVQTYTLKSNRATDSIPTRTTFRPKSLGAMKLTATASDGPTSTLDLTVLRPPYKKVAPILFNKCAPCHTTTPYALPIWASSSSGTAADSTTGVASRANIIARIQGTGGIMPPTGSTALTAAELKTLLTYFGY